MNYQALFQYIKEWLSIFIKFFRLRIMSTLDKDLEIIALRSQLALFYNEVEYGKRPKPKAKPAFRQLWVLLSKHYTAWESILAFFKPATVIRWHKTAFKLFWMFKSRKKGRPSISPHTIALIRRIHKENSLLSPEKIHQKNRVNHGKHFLKIMLLIPGEWILQLFLPSNLIFYMFQL